MDGILLHLCYLWNPHTYNPSKPHWNVDNIHPSGLATARPLLAPASICDDATVLTGGTSLTAAVAGVQLTLDLANMIRSAAQNAWHQVFHTMEFIFLHILFYSAQLLIWSSAFLFTPTPTSMYQVPQFNYFPPRPILSTMPRQSLFSTPKMPTLILSMEPLCNLLSIPLPTFLLC